MINNFTVKVMIQAALAEIVSTADTQDGTTSRIVTYLTQQIIRR